MPTAQTFLQRLKGALGTKRSFPPIFFPRCKAIHTCFMRQNIQLEWLDKKGQVIKRVHQAKPWRIYRCKEAYGVIEYSYQRK